MLMYCGQSITLVTFNTGGTPWASSYSVKRYQAFCHEFECLPLDVIQLQEVWSYHLLHHLKRSLPSYFWAYERGLMGPRAGLVTLSRTPLSKTRCILFSPVGEPRKKKWINRLKRSVKSKGVLLTQLTPSLTLCNAYLVANGDGDWSLQNRYAQAHTHDLNQLNRVMGELVKQQQDILLTGDFNVPKWSHFYRDFLTNSGMTDVFGDDETPTFHQEFLLQRPEVHCIDDIFVHYSCHDGGMKLIYA
jgi:sphingomyelin phosphodiesterase 2